MVRKLRVQYPGAIYHVMNRGDRREPIYGDDQDRLLFLDTLAEACEKTDWQVHAWCLMIYLDGAPKRPRWLRVDRLLGEWGIPGQPSRAGGVRRADESAAPSRGNGRI